jgi:hypothetical protein
LATLAGFQPAQLADTLLGFHTCPRAKVPDLETMQREMQNCSQEIRNLTIMGMKPGLTSEKKALLLDLERSARAELKRRQKVIEYYPSNQNRTP